MVAAAMERCAVSKRKSGSVTVFVHEDGTVSVGISGRSRTESIIETARKLQNELGDKYTVSPYSMPTDNIKPIGKGNDVGVCSEPKAAEAAHNNPSPIVGMDTVWRGKGKNNHPYRGENLGTVVEGKYEQMGPCETCADPDNIKEYMNYANHR